MWTFSGAVSESVVITLLEQVHFRGPGTNTMKKSSIIDEGLQYLARLGYVQISDHQLSWVELGV